MGLTKYPIWVIIKVPHMGYHTTLASENAEVKEMKVHLKGEFLKNEKIKKKDGSDLLQSVILIDDETVKISKCNFNAKRMDPVELDVNIKITDYGVYITPVNTGN